LEKIIITGGTGFIGKHLVNRLLSYGKYSIALVSNTHNFDPGQFSQTRSQQKAPLRFYTADIRNVDDVSKIFRDERADTCVHLAAKVSVADSIKNPDQTMEINAKGTMNVLEACHESDTKNFVFASSAAVYGDVRELPISEKHSLAALSPYGTSKMLAEQHVLSYTNLKKIQNAVVLRIFNVYGTGQSSESDVITRFASRLSKGLPPIIYGDGEQTRDFISVDDVVQGILLSIRAMDGAKKDNIICTSPVFNMGTGRPTTIKELAQKMIEIFGLDRQTIFEEEKQDSGAIKHSYADMTKSKEVLHFVAKKGMDAGLREIKEQMLIGK
jgi:UDP-glucose 4-epimerase